MILRKRIIKELLRFLLVITLVLPIFPILGIGQAAADTTWTQTTQADFTSGTLVQLDASTSPGDVKLAKAGNGYLYAFGGNNTKRFWRYDIATDNWSALADAPQNVSAGGALAYDGNNYIYALCGAGTKYFLRYNIASNTWSSLNGTPYAVNAGGSLAFTDKYIYAFRGGGQKTFWRYSIAAGTWSSLATTPSAVSGGGALTYGGGDYIYGLEGASTTTFWKYSIASNNWTALAGTPSTVGDGGSLAVDEGKYVYALKGANTVTFWRYNISTNNWTAMADTPATPCVYGGGALAYDKDAHLYALRGNNQRDFWKYDVSGNSWSTKTSTPSAVAYGGALVFRAAPYYASGNLTSSTYDTGVSTNFGNISWTATTPAGTSIKFQIATNNDSATWVFKGPDGTSGTYYTSSGTAIWSGHDSDRYIKYKAFFSTADTAITPVLNDVSINYSPWIILPSATTNTATSVEETTATLNGVVTNDGGEACQYRFEYGTSPGVYTLATVWTGSLTTGQSFSSNITGLNQGTKYYFRAQLKNSVGIGSGVELNFLTKPEAPSALSASSVNSTKINLSWTKGVGANRTRLMRKLGSYPTDYNDGTQVYFDTGASVSDTGLTPSTLYFYRAWSEVTVGSSQQWSDGYASVSASTSGAPSASTSDATLVEETTATFHGTVTSDGGEACEYRFEYGTAPGVYTLNTGWMGSKTTGQPFSVDVISLGKGTKYYFLAQVKNSAGIGSGAEFNFLTKPDEPVSTTFIATPVSDTQIDVSWTKGEGAWKTMVRRQIGSYPVDRNDGDLVYFDTGTSVSDIGLTPETLYYYRAWSYVSGSEQWSDNYQDTTAQTAPAPTPTPTPTQPPVSVGGFVYPIDKMQVLAPWLGIFGFLLLVAGGVTFKLVRIKFPRR